MLLTFFSSAALLAAHCVAAEKFSFARLLHDRCRGRDCRGEDTPTGSVPGLPLVPDNSGTGAPATAPLFPGGASTAPPSDPAATGSPFNSPTAAPTAVSFASLLDCALVVACVLLNYALFCS
jgi:hypothetical protein